MSMCRKGKGSGVSEIEGLVILLHNPYKELHSSPLKPLNLTPRKSSSKRSYESAEPSPAPGDGRRAHANRLSMEGSLKGSLKGIYKGSIKAPGFRVTWRLRGLSKSVMCRLFFMVILG